MPHKNIFQRIEYQRQWALKNRERLQKQKRTYYLKNAEAIKRKQKRWSAKNAQIKKERDRLYYQRNKDRIKGRMVKYYYGNKNQILLKGNLYRKKNKEIVQTRNSLYYQKNREKILHANKARWQKNKYKYAKTARTYKLANRSKIKRIQAEYFRKNPHARVAQNLRIRLYKILKRKNNPTGSIFKLVGCSLETLRRHLEKNFQKGMSWENYGKVWHVDHIVPMALFDNKREAHHFFNLRPLLIKPNLVKGKNPPSFFRFKNGKLAAYRD